ncbi:MAG TPA: hypothetical protein VGR53_09270 [Nitrososphaerales archaeon]|nr:hypothetical protein [Nitrososphaerales archaeon]
MSRVLRRMKTQKYSRAFGVYLIVPDVQSYVRIASEKGMPGLIGDMMGRLGVAGKAKALLGGSLSALNRNPVSAMRTYLDAETSGFIGAMPKRCELRSLIMHELFTELVVSFKLQDLALAYVEHVKDSMNVLPGFATRNFARFVDFASEAGLPMKELVILAPFNKVGFQMNPSREECEAKLAQIGETNVIAMSILASGFLGLQESVDYIRKLPKPVSCVVGVSSEVHAQETFSLLRRSFSTHS